jgi:hypothetical protein
MKLGSTYNKVADIKDYPAMGGAPEKIETTTLSQEVSTFVNGVQALDSFEFLANYDPENYKTLSAEGVKNTILTYILAFGKSTESGVEQYGTLGSFEWDGQLSVWVEGGGINAVREMRISISATSEVKFSDTPFTVSSKT